MSSSCFSGRSQCVSSSELLRSEEDVKKDEEEGENKHFTVEINFDEVWHSSLLGAGFFPLTPQSTYELLKKENFSTIKRWHMRTW